MEIVQRHFERLHDERQRLNRPAPTLAPRADGTALVTVPQLELPTGWSTSTVTVYFVVPVGYPAARPDCFWTDPALRLASGMMPTNAQINTNHGGADPLLWFSFHPSNWTPARDDLQTYLRIITTRFREAR